MTSRIIEIRIVQKEKNSYSLYLNGLFYLSSYSESSCLISFITEYFKELLIEIDLDKKSYLRMKFQSKNSILFKNQYKENDIIYIFPEASIKELKEICKSLGFLLKDLGNGNYQFNCLRNLVEVESYVSPALYHSSRENQWYIIGCIKEIPIHKEINLFFDILYIQLFCEAVEIPIDENAYKNYNDWESYNYTTDEDESNEYKKFDDNQQKLF